MRAGQKQRWHQKTRHHRCPRRWGGTTCRGNIIILPRWEHDAWHRLVNHMYPTSTAVQLNTWGLYPSYNFQAVRKGFMFPDLSVHAQECDTITERMTRVHISSWYTLRRGWNSSGVSTGNAAAVAQHISARYLHPDFILMAQKRSEAGEETALHSFRTL